MQYANLRREFWLRKQEKALKRIISEDPFGELRAGSSAKFTP
jgi:hypothetical protein